MRKISAPYILSPNGKLLENHTLIVDNEIVMGLVDDVLADAEFFDGIIVPGFINAHCHLELSHLKDKIGMHTGLYGFIKDIISIRKTYTHGINESISDADETMWKNGIQGVGDICNTNLTFDVKSQSKIRYHNFIELFDMNPVNAEDAFNSGLELFKKSESYSIRTSIVPHAPYSVSGKLFRLIREIQERKESWWCIHNQETASENEMFINGTGVLEKTFRDMGIDRTWFKPTGKNSNESICEFFPASSNLLFIHNTYSSKKDLDFLSEAGIIPYCWFGLCVKANLYIENILPDIPMFVRNNCKIVLGTDSLASNSELSILEEIKTIHNSFPEIEIEKLLTWVTINGAEYFGWNDLGSFQKGKKPGVILVSDSDKSRIGSRAKVERII